jgi:hypothetical protein
VRSDDQQQRKKRAQAVGEGVLAGTERFLADRFAPAVKIAPAATKQVLKAAPGLGSAVYGAARVLTAPDRARAVAGVAGGLVGGGAGGLMGVATGPGAVVAAPLGAAVGSVAGQAFAEDLYDGWQARNARRMAETRRINDRRNAEQRRNGR